MLGIPVLRRTRQMFYGWWIVLAGAVTMAMSTGLFFHGFGFFFEPMRTQFGWSRTLLSGAFSLTRVESGFIGPLEGYLIQRIGPRTTITVGFVIFGLGFVFLSQVNSPLSFYLAFAVLSLGSSLSGYNPIKAALNNWFRRMRAKAQGFAMLGLGLGGVVITPILAFCIEQWGWEKAAIGSGVFLVAVGLPLARLVRFTPEPYGYLPDGERPRPGGSTTGASGVNPTRAARPRVSYPEYDFTVREAMKTSSFWLLAIGHSLALLVISAVSLHQVPYLETDLGLSKVSAAQVVMVLTGVTMFGQAAGGILGERYPKRYILSATVLGHSGALWLLAVADSFPLVMLSAVIQGLAWGARAPLINALRGDYFGRKSFAMISGYSQVVTMLGLMVGPLLAGYFADHFSYSLGFKVIALCALPAFFLFLFLRNPQPRADRGDG